MIGRSETFKKLKDASLRVPLLGGFFNLSKISRLFQYFRRLAPEVSTGRGERAGIFRISHYKFDILGIFLIVTAAFLFAGKPTLDLNLSSSDNPVPSVQPAEATKEEIAMVGKVEEIKELKERNIFTANGTYAESADKMPENPYYLIGVLRGKEKKAVFKDYTGSVITLTAGKTLIDGFKIVRIDDISVNLERRGEKKELRMFELGKTKEFPAQTAPQIKEDRGRVQAPPVQAATVMSQEERNRMQEESRLKKEERKERLRKLREEKGKSN